MMLNDVNFDTYLKNYPDEHGFFGKYGGCYISPELSAAMAEITISSGRSCAPERRRSPNMSKRNWA